MPIYEYRCKQCGTQFEKMRRVSDDSPVLCSACNGADTEKLLSKTSFVLKGSGWYVTDYARGGQNKESGADSKSESPVSSDGAKSSEAAKPAEAAKSTESPKPEPKKEPAKTTD